MPKLEPFPRGWTRALAVVAHPDDMEYGAAAAVAKWVEDGRDIRYALLTSGEAGIVSIEPRHAGPIRELEQRAACKAVGVEKVEFLSFPDGLLEAGVDLRRAVAGAIRRHRPDVVITINGDDFWEHADGSRSWNHADHRVTGQVVLDAVTDAANPWVFTDQGEAWEGVRHIAIHGTSRPTHFVEVEGQPLEAAIASLRCHDAYLSALRNTDMADPGTWLTAQARADGELAGVNLATTFEVLSHPG